MMKSNLKATILMRIFVPTIAEEGGNIKTERLVLTLIGGGCIVEKIVSVARMIFRNRYLLPGDKPWKRVSLKVI
jgi:hypothetical protein